MLKKIISLILCIYCISCTYVVFNKTNASEKFKKNYLGNTSMLFSGDSISRGSANGDRGWSYYIGEKIPLKENINASVGGATISTSRSNNRVLFQLQKYKDKSFDYVILHGGINDAMDEVPLGKISTSFDVRNFNSDTFAGALEEYFYYATTYFKNARIGFIINYRTPHASESGWAKNTNYPDDYFKLAKKIADKWNIPILDFYFGSACDLSFKNIITDKYLKDGLHLNELGYKIVTPYIINFMESLPVYKKPQTEKKQKINVYHRKTSYTSIGNFGIPFFNRKVK